MRFQKSDEKKRTRRIAFALRVLQLRQWERERMPTYGTSLGFELFMKLAELAQDIEGPREGVLKRLYLELPYTHQAVRMHLRRLESDGWISLSPSPTDTRVRLVELSSAYIDLFDAYMTEFKSVLDLTADLPADTHPVTA
jgi:DNA-binding MarR family transcriptional regulator